MRSQKYGFRWHLTTAMLCLLVLVSGLIFGLCVGMWIR